jgi:hypothetical protein
VASRATLAIRLHLPVPGGIIEPQEAQQDGRSMIGKRCSRGRANPVVRARHERDPALDSVVSHADESSRREQA